MNDRPQENLQSSDLAERLQRRGVESPGVINLHRLPTHHSQVIASKIIQRQNLPAQISDRYSDTGIVPQGQLDYLWGRSRTESWSSTDTPLAQPTPIKAHTEPVMASPFSAAQPFTPPPTTPISPDKFRISRRISPIVTSSEPQISKSATNTPPTPSFLSAATATVDTSSTASSDMTSTPTLRVKHPSRDRELINRMPTSPSLVTNNALVPQSSNDITTPLTHTLAARPNQSTPSVTIESVAPTSTGTAVVQRRENHPFLTNIQPQPTPTTATTTSSTNDSALDSAIPKVSATVVTPARENSSSNHTEPVTLVYRQSQPTSVTVNTSFGENYSPLINTDNDSTSPTYHPPESTSTVVKIPPASVAIVPQSVSPPSLVMRVANFSGDNGRYTEQKTNGNITSITEAREAVGYGGHSAIPTPLISQSVNTPILSTAANSRLPLPLNLAQNSTVIARQENLEASTTTTASIPSTNSSVPAADAITTSTKSTHQEIDIQQIAMQVSRILTRQLTIERERRGIGKWD